MKPSGFSCCFYQKFRRTDTNRSIDRSIDQSIDLHRFVFRVFLLCPFILTNTQWTDGQLRTRQRLYEKGLFDFFGQDSSTEQLCFGDVVMLGGMADKGENVDSVVVGDGHFTERVRVDTREVTSTAAVASAVAVGGGDGGGGVGGGGGGSRVTPRRYNLLHDSYFRLCPSLRYDMQTEKRRLRRRQSFSSENSTANNELSAVESNLMDEKKMNDAKIEELRDFMSAEGGELLYGMEFQLLHAESGKFLTYAEETSSFILKVGGDDNSKFKFLPRYQYKDDGESIIYTEEVLLKCVSKEDSMACVCLADEGGERSLGLRPYKKGGSQPTKVTLAGEAANFSFR
jgi:hypothetical protein